MKTLIHLKRHGNTYFHLHPLHATVSLFAAFLLALLVVLFVASPAR